MQADSPVIINAAFWETWHTFKTRHTKCGFTFLSSATTEACKKALGYQNRTEDTK